MNQPKLQHQEWYHIKGYDVDRNLQMKTTALIQAMHDTAIEQVIQMKVSATELKPMGLGWVLVQQDLQVFGYPRLGQRIKVTTYPSGKDRLYTYRDYYIHNDVGELMAQASTSWILMDIKARKLAEYPDEIRLILEGSNQMDHLERPRMRKSNLDFDNGKTFEVQYSDIDFNGHLSNQCFFKWMIDSLPLEFVMKHQIRRFHIKFKGEGFEGDQIKALYVHSTETHMHHQLDRNNGIIATGYSLWDKNGIHSA